MSIQRRSVARPANLHPKVLLIFKRLSCEIHEIKDKRALRGGEPPPVFRTRTFCRFLANRPARHVFRNICLADFQRYYWRHLRIAYCPVRARTRITRPCEAPCGIPALLLILPADRVLTAEAFRARSRCKRRCEPRRRPRSPGSSTFLSGMRETAPSRAGRYRAGFR